MSEWEGRALQGAQGPKRGEPPRSWTGGGRRWPAPLRGPRGWGGGADPQSQGCGRRERAGRGIRGGARLGGRPNLVNSLLGVARGTGGAPATPGPGPGEKCLTPGAGQPTRRGNALPVGRTGAVGGAKPLCRRGLRGTSWGADSEGRARGPEGAGARMCPWHGSAPSAGAGPLDRAEGRGRPALPPPGGEDATPSRPGSCPDSKGCFRGPAGTAPG